MTSVRFVDPERIGGPPDDPTSNGLVTSPDDCEQVLAYQLLGDHGELLEEVSAEELLQTRLSTDTNELRGITWFAPLLEPLSAFEKWFDVELQARKLQASIVLWRKVNGSPLQVSHAVDAASSGGAEGADAVRRERWRAGTILTTSQGTDLQFLQPQTNFGDAVPLGRLLLLAIAAGAGLPEYMVACDASNGNFASTMVAEGPAVKLFESEQHFFADQWNRLWDKVLDLAVERGVLAEAIRQQVVPRWSFPQLVNRDRVQERTVDARLIEAGVLSRSEVARRDEVDPHVMREERANERDTEPAAMPTTAQNGGEQHAVG
jgi:capsid protein